MAVVTRIYIGLENKTAGSVSPQLRPSVLFVKGSRTQTAQTTQLTEERSNLRPRRKDSGKTHPERKRIHQMLLHLQRDEKPVVLFA